MTMMRSTGHLTSTTWYRHLKEKKKRRRGNEECSEGFGDL